MPTSTIPADVPTIAGRENHSARASTPIRKVVFFGIFGILNLGNECTLQAILYNARERLAGGEFCAISFDPRDTLYRHNLAAIPMTSQDFTNARTGRFAKLFRILFKRLPGEVNDWIRAVKALRGTDLLVMTGTGMVTDYASTAFGFPYTLFRWALAARMARCKVRFVGVGVGPIYQRLSRFFIRFALKSADYRSYRDENSQKRINSVFDSGNDHVFPDLAFSLPDNIFPEHRGQLRPKPQIGLGIMDHRDVHIMNPVEREIAYSAYQDKMCEFVEWLVVHGYQVRILQGDARYDVAPRTELKSRLERRGLRYKDAGIVDEGSSTVEELLAQLAQVDLVISPRFHTLLLGAMMNIPAISISYDPKNDALLESLGLGKYRQEIFELDVQLLVQQFKELQENTQTIKPALRENTDKYRRLLENQYDMIFSKM